jgi:ribokinase
MPKKVLFAGDANIDLVFSGLAGSLQEDKEVFCDGYTSALGGSCTITAAAYARLGGVCDFYGLLGEDDNGQFVTHSLADAGVGLDHLQYTRKVNTGITVSMIHGTSRTQVTFSGCLGEVNESKAIMQNIASYSHIHISGVYGTPAFLPEIAAVLQTARANGVSTSLDTQWDSSGKWEHAQQWLPLLTWLFVNDSEAISLSSSLWGKDVGSLTIAEIWEMLAEKTPCPVIKMGPQGAFAAKRLFPPVEVDRILDTTGAGDSFAAGFLFATLQKGYDLPQAMHFAQASGALACTFTGGTSELFTPARVLALEKD